MAFYRVSASFTIFERQCCAKKTRACLFLSLNWVRLSNVFRNPRHFCQKIAQYGGVGDTVLSFSFTFDNRWIVFGHLTNCLLLLFFNILSNITRPYMNEHQFSGTLRPKRSSKRKLMQTCYPSCKSEAQKNTFACHSVQHVVHCSFLAFENPCDVELFIYLLRLC